MDYVVYYLLVVNVAAFLIYGFDKRRAIEEKWRIPERVLLGVVAIGGSIGSLLGMRTFHHKIRKQKFVVGVPTILIMQIAAIYYVTSFMGK